jgi:pantetheine-phosphate adenylyltransferase
LKVAIYPGTFDPITYGHLNVIRRSAGLFDRLIVAVARNQKKRPCFSIRERIEMIREVVSSYRNVEVDSLEGLLVDYAKKRKATVIVRGLRAVSDFEYEFQMTLMNRKLNPNVETVFMMPNESYTYLNSGVVKEIAMQRGDVSRFVPESIARRLYKRFGIVTHSKKTEPRRLRVR